MKSFMVILSALCAWVTLISSVTATKGVFCHYMVGGIEADQAKTDVQDAKAMGIDAFALNVATLDPWSNAAVQLLFDAADENDFKLFFSFDMDHFSAPGQFLPLLLQWHAHDSYYVHDATGKPFVSTFYGGTLDFGYSSVNAGWQAEYKDALSAMGIETYFVPAFSDASVAPDDFFDEFSVADGVFNWDSWANTTVGATVNAVIDRDYMAGAQAANKSFIMGISALQFKHLDTSDNWWRGGALDLTDRIGQVLELAPDYIEIQSWNDGGESHYIGNIWPYAIAASPEVKAQITGYDHAAFQRPLTHLITAYKAGHADLSAATPAAADALADGVFWYHTLLTSADCAADPLGKPQGLDLVENVVSVAIVLSAAAAAANATIDVYSDDRLIGSEPAHPGLNAWSASGVRVGRQRVEVRHRDGALLVAATGNASVVADADLCNYNFQVVELQ
ncbi:MAG: hypothetical protein M1818_004904 [Claussenomyces sp. TS43310]|nr:MAG: hypothetical protein M1818_004904 [Claussenomyces sp. TS43310]